MSYQPKTATPGPWQVCWPLRDLSITEVRTVANERIGHVATMGVSFPEAETQTNARLIAAAPDLLACKAALAGIDELMANMVQRAPEALPKDISIEPWSIILQAHAAIAKAEGKGAV